MYLHIYIEECAYECMNEWGERERERTRTTKTVIWEKRKEKNDGPNLRRLTFFVQVFTAPDPLTGKQQKQDQNSSAALSTQSLLSRLNVELNMRIIMPPSSSTQLTPPASSCSLYEKELPVNYHNMGLTINNRMLIQSVIFFFFFYLLNGPNLQILTPLPLL